MHIRSIQGRKMRVCPKNVEEEQLESLTRILLDTTHSTPGLTLVLVSYNF